MPEKEEQKIELRSEEVQDILGHVPAWIVRWGILVVLITVILIIVGSWFFRYPDIKRANVFITTENPPATLVARSNGKIQDLFVEDNQYVTAGTRLAIIENASDYKDVLLLDEITTEIRLKDLRQIRSLHKRELDLIYNQFIRDSMLFVKKVTAPADFDKSKSNLLGKQYEYEQVKINESETDIQIAKLNQGILDLELSAAEETRKQQNAWQESFENLAAQISLWKQKDLLDAPIDGVVSFTTYWSKNQNVREGERVMTIIPSNEGKIIGKINLPIQGAGKVSLGQQVNIKVDNFPYLAYGMIKGDRK